MNSPSAFQQLASDLAERRASIIYQRTMRWNFSEVVTLKDIGVKGITSNWIRDCGEFPLLRDLRDRRPDLFLRGNITNVKTLIHEICNDPNL
jgi:hypothetical protein